MLVEDFDIENGWRHSLTVDHRSNGTVFSRGSGSLPLSLDHHRGSPFENLYTKLGDYDFSSGGSACAAPTRAPATPTGT